MTTESKPKAPPKPSKVEALKIASEYLRVPLADEVDSDGTSTSPRTRPAS